MEDLIRAINEVRSKVEYGDVNISLHIHRGQVMSFDATTINNIRVEGTKEGAAMVMQLYKAAQLNKERATITTTAIIQDGEMKDLQIIDVKKYILK